MCVSSANRRRPNTEANRESPPIRSTPADCAHTFGRGERGKKRVNDTAAADPTKEKKSFARTWTRAGQGQRRGKAISPELLAGQTPCPRSRSVAFGSISGVVVERIKTLIISFLPRQNFPNADLQGFECRGLREKGFPGKRLPPPENWAAARFSSILGVLSSPSLSGQANQ